MFFLHQYVDATHFQKISAANTANEAWDILEKCYTGGEKVKKVRLQALRRQYELMQIEDLKKVADYFNQVLTLTNLMAGCGEKLSDQTIIEKILCTLAPRFDHIVVAIEESKNLGAMEVEELQGSLVPHELRLNERSTDKPVDQALQAQVARGGGGDKGKKGKGKFTKGCWLSNQERSKTDGDRPESSKRGGGFARNK